MLYNYLPLTNVPEKFSISIAGVNYIIYSRWNDADNGGWFLDFYDQDELPILMNVPLVTGANLLEQYDYLGFNATLYVITEGDQFAVPTLNSLGIESQVVVLTL